MQKRQNQKKIIFDFSLLDNKLILKIIDDGKGIKEENISKIFELGYTTTNGSGIGLYQNLDIIKNMSLSGWFMSRRSIRNTRRRM